MAVKVIDASALAALLFGEPDGDTVADRFGQSRLSAPPLLAYEIANTCVKKIRRHPTQRDYYLRAFTMYRRLPMEIVSVDLAEAVSIADRFGLSAYDASYLWLARALDAELVTLDKKLDAARARLSRA